MLLDFSSWFRNIREEQYPTPLLFVILFALIVLVVYVIQPPEKLTTQELVARIVASGRISRCAQVHGVIIDGIDYETVCRNNIAYQRALKTLDPEYCKGLDDRLISIEQCEAGILLEKINAGAALETCNLVSSDRIKANCRTVYWMREAIQKDDKALCENMENIGDRSYCRDGVELARFLKNPDGVDCSVFSGSLASDCKNFKKAISGSTQGCYGIFNRQFQAECLRRAAQN